MKTQIFAATKAFIIFGGKALILKESSKYKDGFNADKYDVVGGRVKPGQRFDESLLREIKEEAGLKVKIGRPFFVDEWRYAAGDAQWQIVGTFFECEAKTGKVILGADHKEYKWINPKDYAKYNIIPGLDKVFKEYISYKKL